MDKTQQKRYGTAARNANAPTELTPETIQRHQESLKRHPRVALSHTEYVIEEVRRHPIGIVSIWFIVSLLICLLFGALAFYSVNVGAVGDFLSAGSTIGSVALPTGAQLFPWVGLLCVLAILGGVVATIIYEGNEFYVTNEAIFQFVQTSLFDTKTQVVNLINVEDVSQDQRGILQQLLNYGTLRVSTQGEETTYHFYYVANPGRIVNIVNDASEKAVLRMQGVPVSEH